MPPIPVHSGVVGGGAEMASLPEVGPGKPQKNMHNYEMVAIKEDCLTLGAELGQGEFGSVLRGKYRPPGGKLVSFPPPLLTHTHWATDGCVVL